MQRCSLQPAAGPPCSQCRTIIARQCLSGAGISTLGPDSEANIQLLQVQCTMMVEQRVCGLLRGVQIYAKDSVLQQATIIQLQTASCGVR